MALSGKQRGVLTGMAIGTVTIIVVFVAAIVLDPFTVSYGAGFSPGHKISFALKADAFLAVWVAISIGRLVQHRFFTPTDIDGSGLTPGSDKAHELQAVLQNSLEQTVLAVLVHVIWAVTMPAAWLSAVPAAVMLFIVGRLLFARGYHHGAPHRALGFVLTFYPSVMMLVIIAVMTSMAVIS